MTGNMYLDTLFGIIGLCGGGGVFLSIAPLFFKILPVLECAL